MAKGAEDLEQILRVPSGSFAPSLDRSLVGGLSHQVEGEMADNGHVPGAVAGAETRLVFIEGHVERRKSETMLEPGRNSKALVDGCQEPRKDGGKR